NIQLKKNDKLFFYTDGALDMFESRAREEAIHKLQNLLEKNADFPVQKLVSNICEQVSEEPQDDVLIFALQLLNRRAKEKQITIPSIPSEVSRVEDVILPALSAKGYGERYLFAVKLALEEAIINAIKHGNKLDSTKKVRTNFILDENKTIISIADEGEGFDPGSIPDPIDGKQLDSVYGRGVALMKAYMDSVEYNEKGNKVTMTKYAPWHSKNSGP
ncbi:MAG: ATP-binding protein, partial [Planctomycetes bacterium]|nr:ATP-binding protein [Planctomycetota bacterium]